MAAQIGVLTDQLNLFILDTDVSVSALEREREVSKRNGG